MTKPNLSQALARIESLFYETEDLTKKLVSKLERTNPHKKLDVRV